MPICPATKAKGSRMLYMYYIQGEWVLGGGTASSNGQSFSKMPLQLDSISEGSIARCSTTSPQLIHHLESRAIATRTARAPLLALAQNQHQLKTRRKSMVRLAPHNVRTDVVCHIGSPKLRWNYCPTSCGTSTDFHRLPAARPFNLKLKQTRSETASLAKSNKWPSPCYPCKFSQYGQ